MSLRDVIEGRARWELLQGDSMQVLPYLPAESIDALVTDPPAGIGFMGKEWDSSKGGRARWVMWLGSVMLQAFRVMKPGAHGLVWALPRTSHWTATALEDAGFEVRDRVSHLFGTGFPKSADVSKALDKRAGAKRKVVGVDSGATITAPAADAAKLWDGWGTALKPAVEDWWLVRKPLAGTVAANVAKWGTGAINVDGCRIGLGGDEDADKLAARSGGSRGFRKDGYVGGSEDGGLPPGWDPSKGRWPAHLTLDEEAAALLDAQSGPTRPGHRPRTTSKGVSYFGSGTVRAGAEANNGYGDSGGASRFFYIAKTSTAERNSGGANNHPTVKPLALMRWLCRLITPPGGVVLDPFAGSGSTGIAALQEGFRFLGIERDEAYARIARARLEAAVAEPAQPELFATT